MRWNYICEQAKDTFVDGHERDDILLTETISS